MAGAQSIEDIAKWMRSILLVLPILVVAESSGAKSSTQGEIPDGYDQRYESNEIIYLWRESETDESIAAASIKLGDKLFEGVASFLGEERLPKEKLIVVLDGHMFKDDSRNFPRIDDDGRVFLYRTDSPMNQFMSAFAHELVHALRFQSHLEGSLMSILGTGFFEEGFAEAVALQVEGHANRYPYWGISPIAINAYLIENDLVIPFEQLINKHSALSLNCEAQSYPLRGSFLTYLDSVLGREAFLKMADDRGVRDTAFYEKHSGKAFNDLVTDWRKFVLTQVEQIPESGETALEWVAVIEKIGFKFCENGVEY